MLDYSLTSQLTDERLCLNLLPTICRIYGYSRHGSFTFGLSLLVVINLHGLQVLQVKSPEESETNASFKKQYI